MGWVRRGERGGASPARSHTPAQREPGSSSSGGADRKGKGPDQSGSASPAGGGSRYSSPRRRPGGSGGSFFTFVCWHCLQTGHSWAKCHTLPKGWTPSAEDKAKALAKEEELKKRRDQSSRDRATHAAKVASEKASLSSSSSEGRASGSLYGDGHAFQSGHRDCETWLVDSGASHHMSPCIHDFTAMRDSPMVKVWLADDSAVPVIGQGDVYG